MGREAGLGEVIETGGNGPGSRRITGWLWKGVPEPALPLLPRRGQAWERARHRAYQAYLAGHSISETFKLAVTFLMLTSANAASTKVIGADTRR